MSVFEDAFRARAEFVTIDLRMALTLVRRALAELDAATRQRNLRSARHAYLTCLDYLRGSSITGAQRTEILQLLKELRTALRQEHEDVPPVPARS